MNRITSAFSGVVGGTSVSSSDKADTSSIHPPSIRNSSHTHEHSSSSYLHEHVLGQTRRPDLAFGGTSNSVAPSPTEADFPLEHSQSQGRRTQERYHPDTAGASGGLEYLYDDPRRPYYCQNLAPSPGRTSWHQSTVSGGSVGGGGGSVGGSSSGNSGSNHDGGRKSSQLQGQQQHPRSNLALGPGSSGITTSSGFSKTGSFGSSSLASASFSHEDADYALPFSHAQAAHTQQQQQQHMKNGSGSFASSSSVAAGYHSDSEGSRIPYSHHPHLGLNSRAYAGPDRYVKTVITYATYSGTSNRRGNRGGGGGNVGTGGAGGQADRPLGFKSMAKGPEGSNRVVLAANDALRIVAITSPTTSSSAASSKPASSSPLAQDEKSSSTSSQSTSSTSSIKPAGFTSTGGPRAIAHGPGGARIEEVVNLWKGVPQGSVARVVNCVDWGVGAMGNKVLTACSNGNFMVFDVERNRFEREVSAGHSRAMLCLAMSKTPAQGHRVLTAGADGFAKLWDLRQPQNPALMSVRHPSPIVSLAFSPPGLDNASAQNSYILGLENGSIFRYEWRMAARSVGRITAAHGAKAVMALEWKECGLGDRDAAGGQGVGSGGWLASGGLDRTVKIWDMTAVEMPTYPYHTIFTPHPVRRLAWRPGHDTEIAVVSIPTTTTFGTSCKTMQQSQNNEEGTAAEQMDESRLEVWDVRRGHVAKYILGKASRFGETGAVTDLIWPDGYAVQTCYSNGAVVQHDIRSHIRPLDHMPRQAVAWSPQGEATFSLDRWVVGEIPFDDIKPEFTEQALPFARKAISDPPFSTRQVTLTFPPDQLADDKFRYLAYAYKLEPGENTDDTCEWNAQCASEVDEHQHMRLWLLVKQLFQRQQEHPVPNVDGRVGPIAPLSATATGDRIPEATFDSAPPDASCLAFDNSSQNDKGSSGKEGGDSRSEESSIKPKQPQQAVTMADLRSSNNTKRRASSSDSSSGSDSPPYDDISKTPMPGKLQLGSLTPSIQDSHLSDASAFRFGGASSAKTPGTTSMKSPLFNALSRLPNTGVSEGDDDIVSVNGGATRPSRPAGPHARPSMYHVREDTAKSETASTVRVSPSIQPAFSRRPSDMVSLPTAVITVYQNPEEKRRVGQRLKVLRDWRVFHVSILRTAYTTMVERGEVQTACAIYLVAGHVLGLSDQEGQMLVETYLDQLDRRRLSGVAAAIRRDYKGTKSQTLAETVIQSRCGKCRKSVEFEGKPAPWFCDSCKSALVACVVCHLPVKGLYTGCSKCAHGGHESCMRDVEVRHQPRYHYNDRTQQPRSHSPSPFNNWRQMATPGKRYSSPTGGTDAGCTRSPSRGPLSSAGDATTTRTDHDDPLDVTGSLMTWDAYPRSCVTGCGCACNGP